MQENQLAMKYWYSKLNKNSTCSHQTRSTDLIWKVCRNRITQRHTVRSCMTQLKTLVGAVTNQIRCNSGLHWERPSDLWATALYNFYIHKTDVPPPRCIISNYGFSPVYHQRTGWGGNLKMFCYWQKSGPCSHFFFFCLHHCTGPNTLLVLRYNRKPRMHVWVWQTQHLVRWHA